MRKLLVFVLIILSTTTGCMNRAEAIGPDQARIAKFWIGKSYYEIDGKRYDMDVAPYVKNDRTMMPVRYIAYSLGLEDKDIKWNDAAQFVVLKRGTEEMDMQVGRTVFGVNGRPTIGHLDVGPELVPPGRVMMPFRAIAQALGALVFWDEVSHCVTVETWREAPQPTVQTVKKVTVYKNQNYADVVDMSGSQKRVKTSRPAMITDTRDGGFTLDALVWFKLWGVSTDNMLYDPVRGGLAVRGASGYYPGKASGYLYFYVSDKYAFNNFFETTKFGPSDKPGANFIKDGSFYSDGAALNGTQNLYGKLASGPITADSITCDLN